MVHDARCGPAGDVIRGLFAGQGRHRRDPKTGQIDKIIDGWICGSGAGGFSCAKLGPHGTIRPINLRHLGPIIDAEGLCRGHYGRRDSLASHPINITEPLRLSLALLHRRFRSRHEPDLTQYAAAD